MGEEFILRVAIGLVLGLLAGAALLALVAVGHRLVGGRRVGRPPSAGDPDVRAAGRWPTDRTRSELRPSPARSDRVTEGREVFDEREIRPA
ncbi:hypothetical protein [Streptomyces sp. NPDC005907]|uniref:hypothetical protein n=1 Tax=Streptomyces sp. NPDC005907 TaxID=3154571 RepID=UPI0033C2927F